LSISLGALLHMPGNGTFVRTLLQLWEEYLHHATRSAASVAAQTKSHIPRATRAAALRKAPAAMTPRDEAELAPSLLRHGGEVLYTALMTPPLSHALSGAQVNA
jgi:hypothetical protein